MGRMTLGLFDEIEHLRCLGGRAIQYLPEFRLLALSHSLSPGFVGERVRVRGSSVESAPICKSSQTLCSQPHPNPPSP